MKVAYQLAMRQDQLWVQIVHHVEGLFHQQWEIVLIHIVREGNTVAHDKARWWVIADWQLS